MFKSYYVVWKHESNNNIIKYSNSLNRTMQYGNSLCRDKKVTKNRGLNRTMQYGNLIFLDFLR